jgi:hypothetical protein
VNEDDHSTPYNAEVELYLHFPHVSSFRGAYLIKPSDKLTLFILMNNFMKEIPS